MWVINTTQLVAIVYHSGLVNAVYPPLAFARGGYVGWPKSLVTRGAKSKLTVEARSYKHNFEV